MRFVDNGKLASEIEAALTSGGIARGATGRRQRILSLSESELSLIKITGNLYSLFLNRRTRRNSNMP
jgi:hypothetical protein